MVKLTDDSPMPWGAHRGKPLDEVPADYLLWLYEVKGISPGPLRDYIIDNLDVLRKQVREQPYQKSWK